MGAMSMSILGNSKRRFPRYVAQCTAVDVNISDMALALIPTNPKSMTVIS